MMIEKLWYQPNHFTHFLRPFSWIFRGASAARRTSYQIGLKKTTRFSVPVIVVGNLTVGGTGKTPLVAWMANLLQSHGYRPGMISRGHRGKSSKWPQCVTSESNPRDVGDEPVLLARQTQCPVVVDPHRVIAANTLLEKYRCDVIISDDGLQHYALGRDIEIAVVDGIRQFGNKLCLPAGPLREPLHRLNQVDFVVHHGISKDLNVFSMQLIPSEIRNIADDSKHLSLEECRQQQWHAVAGIGNPERFFLQLEQLGLKIQKHTYPDHYAFSKKEIEFGKNEFVIMTEKDAVKCRHFSDDRHWYLPVTAKLSENFEKKLLERLQFIVTPRLESRGPAQHS